jgi:hypothetical protein
MTPHFHIRHIMAFFIIETIPTNVLPRSLSSWTLPFCANSLPLLFQYHERRDDSTWNVTIRSSECTGGADRPEDTKNAIIEMNETEICSWDPDIEDINDKLETCGPPRPGVIPNQYEENGY